ncbi:MAG: NAD(P)-dependent oxidoreductase [Bacteroidota bacterium]
MQRNVLVIGGAGYIGSVLSQRLLSQGYKVTALDNLTYGTGNSIGELIENPDFRFVKGDFGDQPLLDQLLGECTDVVLLAAMVGDPICKKYPELTQKVNVDYPKNLFSSMNRKGIKNFVFTSTCSNYGLRTDDTLANEESELNPQSLYAETKIEFEKHILANGNDKDFSSTILRLSTAFGVSNRMRFDLTVSQFTRELALGKDLLVYDENTWRPYCNVADISDVIIKVMESPKETIHNEVFNVGSDHNNFTKKMIVDLIDQVVPGTKVEYKENGMDPRNYKVSFEKLKSKLNYEPKVNVEDSVKALSKAIENGLYHDIETEKNFFGNYAVVNQ